MLKYFENRLVVFFTVYLELFVKKIVNLITKGKILKKDFRVKGTKVKIQLIFCVNVLSMLLKRNG